MAGQKFFSHFTTVTEKSWSKNGLKKDKSYFFSLKKSNSVV